MEMKLGFKLQLVRAEFCLSSLEEPKENLPPLSAILKVLHGCTSS